MTQQKVPQKIIGDEVYLVDGLRTPFGKFGGSLKDYSPVDLALACSSKLLEKLKFDKTLIDQVILGSIIPTTTDTMYGGRHLALKLGLPLKTPAYNVNRLCGTGIQILWDAFNLIKLNRAQAILATGSEAMSGVPHLVYGGRFGTKYGALKNGDMLLDALTDAYSKTPMGITAENVAKKYDITRQEADVYATNSHKKAARAYSEGNLHGEICAIKVGNLEVSEDEHLRKDVSLEEMSKLRASFLKDGVVTAANASGIVDGSAAALVAKGSLLLAQNITPLARLVDFEVIGVEPTEMGLGPVPAIRNLIQRNGLTLDQVDLFEINEAFAPQALACAKELKIPLERLNQWGGAVALGHPLAASGVRITTTLARQMQLQNKKIGIASACIGGGQGIAVLITRS